MLNINGRCAVILPDGQDLFTKTNTSLISIREYLIKTCDLQEIIYLPSGIFEHTSIKTCIFFFTKKRDGKDIIKVNTKISKSTNKELSRSYKFVESHQTKSIKFYEYNPDRETKTELIEVNIENIAKNSYSLNYTEYLKDDNNETIYDNNSDIEIKTLGEVCDIKCGNHSTKKSCFINGEYLIIGGGKQPIGTHNEYNCNENTILCASHGTAGYISMYPVKTFLTMAFAFIENKELINKMYLYYYLKSIQNDLLLLGRGTAQPCISMDKLKNIEIPIPSLEKQNEIVEYLDFIYEKSIKTSYEKINQLKELNKMYIDSFTKYGKNEMKSLGELCNFIKTGKNKPTDNKTGSLYPYYGTGSITGYTDEYLYDGNYLLTARNGTIGNCFITNGRFFPSDHIFVIDINDKCLLKLVYYILNNNDNLNKLKTGVGIPNITKSVIENFKIPIPSIEKQQEIVQYCEHNYNLIKQLETEIENNKKHAKEFLDMILNISTNDISITHPIDDEKSLDEQIEEHKSNTLSMHQSTDNISNISNKSTRSLGLLSDSTLKEMCKERNIKGMSNKKKPLLAKTLLDYHNDEKNNASSSYNPLSSGELSEINRILENC
jgi:type I restriction enzyme S subunit